MNEFNLKDLLSILNDVRDEAMYTAQSKVCSIVSDYFTTITKGNDSIYYIKEHSSKKPCKHCGNKGYIQGLMYRQPCPYCLENKEEKVYEICEVNTMNICFLRQNSNLVPAIYDLTSKDFIFIDSENNTAIFTSVEDVISVLKGKTYYFRE